MNQQKKSYQKPVVEKVNLRLEESVLTFCKTALNTIQPAATSNRKCDHPASPCVDTIGS
jgi:hypothetical protein